MARTHFAHSLALAATGNERYFRMSFLYSMNLLFRHSLRRWLCALPLLLCLGAATVRAATPAPRAPNIVILLADDLGRADLGYAGSDIRTPNIDRLVATGVRLDRFYACPVCSPTRGAKRSCTTSGFIFFPYSFRFFVADGRVGYRPICVSH